MFVTSLVARKLPFSASKRAGSSHCVCKFLCLAGRPHRMRPISWSVKRRELLARRSLISRLGQPCSAVYSDLRTIVKENYDRLSERY
jgi:hypothetical protein